MMKVNLRLIFVAYFIVGHTIFDNNDVDATEVSGKGYRLEKKAGTKVKCSEFGQPCQSNSSCCLGYCGTENTCMCTKKFNPCEKGKECCVGLCKIFNENMGFVCHCSEISEPCSVLNNKTCCEGFCDAQSALCKCIDGIGKCKLDKECCRGNCNKSGDCICLIDGSTCYFDKECCGGVCQNEKCRTCAMDFGTKCTNDGECCKGSCNHLGFCNCASIVGACAIDRDCCGGTCDNGQCDCVLLDVFQPGSHIYCNPALKDPCCFGICKLNSTNNFECILNPQNGHCNLFSDCETKVCVNGRCSCHEVGGSCGVNVQCCAGLICNVAAKKCETP